VPDDNSNGRLRLTWAQMSWAMAVLIVLLGNWYRAEFRAEKLDLRLTALEASVREGTYSKAAIDEMKRDADRVHDELRRDVDKQGGRK
jgi:hypothetical protein